MHSQRGEWCTGPFRRSASPAWSHPGKGRQVAPPGESVRSTVVVLAPVRATDAGKNEYLRRSEVPVRSAETRGLDAQGPRRLAGDGLAGERSQSSPGQPSMGVAEAQDSRGVRSVITSQKVGVGTMASLPGVVRTHRCGACLRGRLLIRLAFLAL